MAVDQFCLKWNNFQSSIITAFESLQNTEDLADVTLTCEGISIKAHKFILSACSPYFRTVFKENPCPHPVVILKDVLHADLLAILNFMYHGEVLVMQDQLMSFLQTAELLQVSGLIGSGEVLNKNFAPTSKTSKAHRMKLSDSEPLLKKSKIAPKLKHRKLTTQIMSPKPAENISTQHITAINSPVVSETNSSSLDQFKMLDTDAIKKEYEKFEDEQHDYNENVEGFSDISEKSNQQCSILEAALEVKDPHSSILERSLTSLSGKSPSLTYPMEHVTVLQDSSSESPKIYVPRKSSEQNAEDENRILKHKLSNKSETFDLAIESVPKSIKLEEDSAKAFDATKESMQPGQGEFSAITNRSFPEVQPHHSSHCGNCPHCGKVYSNQSALKYHVRLVHSDLTNMYCCYLCPESFDYREAYKKHMVEVHSIRN